MSAPAAPRIYLAGPTVFFRDAEVAFARLAQQCQARQLLGVRPAEPMDAEGYALTGAQAARHLFVHNTQRIRQAAGVLADLRPFRGELEPDSGTVFEVGFAHALGKPVAAVVPDPHDWGARIRATCGESVCPGPGSAPMDARYDMLIEDFGGALNLMLSESCQVFRSTEQALDWLATQLAVDHLRADSVQLAAHAG